MWNITKFLPSYLRADGFELTEDEDFVILWHKGAWIGRFHATATNLPTIIATADAHRGSVAVN